MIFYAVSYYDYDGREVDSYWLSQAQAQLRCDELNEDRHRLAPLYVVDKEETQD